MSNFIKRVSLIALIAGCILILIFSDFASGPKFIRYDCRDAHWHPDFPPDVKEECRRLLYDELKKQQRGENRKMLT